MLYILKEYLCVRSCGDFVDIFEKRFLSCMAVKYCSYMLEDEEICRRIANLCRCNFKRNVNDVKCRFYDAAINELESNYFHNISWEERILKLLKMTDKEIAIGLKSLTSRMFQMMRSNS